MLPGRGDILSELGVERCREEIHRFPKPCFAFQEQILIVLPTVQGEKSGAYFFLILNERIITV